MLKKNTWCTILKEKKTQPLAQLTKEKRGPISIKYK